MNRHHIVFFDCGNTLIGMDERLDLTQPVEQGWVDVGPAWTGGSNVIIKGRPDARACVDALKAADEYTMVVLTGGDESEQSRYLQAVGLRDLFARIYGGASRGPAVPDAWVLVEDDEEPISKMKLLGYDKTKLTADQWKAALDRHVVLVAAFYKGREYDPKATLTAVLPVIQEKMRKQIEEKKAVA